MARLPYMPMFVGDYLADTAHLTATEHGAYLLLLFAYWQRGGPLSADPKRLARIARLTPRDATQTLRLIVEFFDVSNGTWIHWRVEEELNRARAKSLKAQESGRMGGKANAKRTPSERLANASETLKRTRSSPSPSSEEEKTKTNTMVVPDNYCSPRIREASDVATEQPAAVEAKAKSRKRSPKPAFDPVAQPPEVYALWCSIVLLRWQLDAVPAKHSAVAGETAAWLVAERSATPDSFVRFVQWWWHDPDSMGFKTKQRPWPVNVRNNWDTAFLAPRPDVDKQAILGNQFKTRSDRNMENLRGIYEHFGIGQIGAASGDHLESVPLFGPGRTGQE